MIQKTGRARLTDAFRLMRKAGLIARQNFSCCGSCASFEIATDVTGMSPSKRDKVLGSCTYNRQAAMSLYGHNSGVYLQYGQVSTREHGPVGLPTIEVGYKVMECLREAGLNPEWDGDPEKKIRVSVPDN